MSEWSVKPYGLGYAVYVGDTMIARLLDVDSRYVYQLFQRLSGRQDTSMPPTADEINALPVNLREFIMRLETEADPAGTLRSLMLLADQNVAMQRMIKGLQEERADG